MHYNATFSAGLVDDRLFTTALISLSEKELKRQIIATHELMMDKIKALSELHHIESPNFDLVS